jgi:hypothetical protein
MNALCSLTALRHLRLQDRHLGADEEDEEDEDGYYHPRAGCMHMVLAPLSALQQLTRLELSMASSLQLQQLQLPRLQHLVLDYLTQYGPGFPQLLGDLTSLTVLDLGGCCGLSATDTLPPSLRTLKLQFTSDAHLKLLSDSRVSLRPLLLLSKLEQLQLDLSGVACTIAAAHEVAQLSTLCTLQDLHILWRSEQLGQSSGTAAAAEAFAAALKVLPL